MLRSRSFAAQRARALPSSRASWTVRCCCSRTATARRAPPVLAKGLGGRRVSDDVAAHVIEQYNLSGCGHDRRNQQLSERRAGRVTQRGGGERVYMLMYFATRTAFSATASRIAPMTKRTANIMTTAATVVWVFAGQLQRLNSAGGGGARSDATSSHTAFVAAPGRAQG